MRVFRSISWIETGCQFLVGVTNYKKSIGKCRKF